MSLSKTINRQLIDDEMIDEILENFTLRRPGSTYGIFYSETSAKLNQKEKKNFNEMDRNKIIATKWAELSKEEKEKYKELKEKNKNRYEYEIEVIRHYLFRDYNDTIQSSNSAFKLFENEKMRESFEKNLDLDYKEIKEKIRLDWKNLTTEERKTYFERQKENNSYYKNVKQIKKVNGITMYIQKVIEMAKMKDQEVPSLEEITNSWKGLPKELKIKFKNYAKAINNEREKVNDIFELVNCAKPKKPVGAYKIFVQEKLLENEIENFDDAKVLWDKLDDDEKEKYLKKAHRLQLAYQYKKMIYDKRIKKILPKKPNIFNEFYKEKKREKRFRGIRNQILEIRKEFEKLSKEEKENYRKKFEIEKKKYDEKMKAFQNCVFDLPKQPVSSYKLFYNERYSQLKKENKKLEEDKLKNIIEEEWEDNEYLREKYTSIAEENKKTFKKQLKEFHKLGYYTKENPDYFGVEEDDESERKSKIKKIYDKEKSLSTHKKKKSISVKKRKDSISKNNQKSGKSQRKNNK